MENAAQALVLLKEETPCRNRLKIFDYEIAYIGIVMIVGALFGFLAENGARLATKGILDSRFMFLPFIGAYGFAALALYVVFGTPDKMRFFGFRFFKTPSRKQKIISNFLYFGMIFFFIFFGEIAVGMIYEKFTGVVLWNYSNMPLSCTKYTSVFTTALYGGGVYLLMKFGFTPFMNMMQRKMNYRAAAVIDLTLGMLILIDSIVMIIITCVTKQAPMHWSIQLW